MFKTNLVIFFIFSAVLIFGSISYAAFPIEYNESIDITKKDLGVKSPENTIIISMQRPAKPMQPFNIDFNFDNDNVVSLKYSTNMKMNMGKFEYEPKELGSGKYLLTLTLPKCKSMDALWYGKLDIKYKSGKTEEVYFFYSLK